MFHLKFTQIEANSISACLGLFGLTRTHPWRTWRGAPLALSEFGSLLDQPLLLRVSDLETVLFFWNISLELCRVGASGVFLHRGEWSHFGVFLKLCGVLNSPCGKYSGETVLTTKLKHRYIYLWFPENTSAHACACRPIYGMSANMAQSACNMLPTQLVCSKLSFLLQKETKSALVVVDKILGITSCLLFFYLLGGRHGQILPWHIYQKKKTAIGGSHLSWIINLNTQFISKSCGKICLLNPKFTKIEGFLLFSFLIKQEVPVSDVSYMGTLRATT